MSLADLSRWMYRGKRPNGLARFLNRASAIAGAWGLGASYMATLEVVGRRSGRLFSLPVVIAEVDGQRFLVSMLGDDVAWVRNVRAAGGDAVLRHGRRERVRLEEVAADRRAVIVKAYLRRAPGARPHIPIDKDAPVSEFETIAPAIPVFRILPRE